MANRNKALLNSLMGMSRNDSRKEKANREPEFKNDEICKNYLIGYCPGKTLGKEIENARTLDPRAEFDPKSCIQPCRLLHSIGVKTGFTEHKDHDKYKRQYQDKLASLLDKALREVEEKVSREKRRHDEGIAVMMDGDRLCEVCGLKYKLRMADVNVRDTGGSNFKPDVHDTSELHKGYVKLRAKLDELDEEIRKREPQDEPKEEGRSSRDRRRRRDDEEEEDRGRNRQKDKDRRSERSRSRSCTGGRREEQRGSDRRNRSGGRDDEDRGQDRGRSREERSRRRDESRSRRR